MTSPTPGPTTRRAEDCLAGGGEMGALMRSLDWSGTRVGPVDGWPQSLRTAVSILLESRFPMYIAWGPKYVQFYNDGFRPILGSTKHPAAMCGRARDTFAESWHIIEPMFDDVLRGVATGAEDWMLPLDRHGFLEECYFTFSYSPVRDESGGVGGVFVTVTETTDRVLGERRLRTLRDLAAGAAEALEERLAWERAASDLAENRLDFPFALLYMLEERSADGGAGAAGPGRVRLAGATGLEAGPAAPVEMELVASGGGGWPLAEALDAGRPILVENVRERFGDLPGGEWPEPPHYAAVLPIARPGRDNAYGLLVAGISARRAWDEPYLDFLGLVADQVASAVANARAYEEERRRVQALAELDHAKTLFFSNVSHEFRTPLTLLFGPVEDLLSGRHGTLAPEVYDQVALVHRSALRLLKLVNTLLDFSRFEAGRVEAVYAPVDLSRLTAELASVFRAAVERAGLTLTVDCPELPEPVYVDPEMWEKVVLNLLSNALKFTFDGEISVEMRWTGRGAELTVRDSGTGIEAAELPLLFERFHRVEGARSRTHEGSGIGLALVQELVHLHGGEVEVDSEPGRGSAFTVTLPTGRDHLPAERIGAGRELASTALGAAPFVEEALRWLPGEADGGSEGGGSEDRESEDREQIRADVRTAGAAPAGTEGAHILIADDNADLREYLQRLLSASWQVEAVADGEAALAAVERRVPDLVLSDVMMPGLDGFELLKRLRTDERTRGVPIILLSARAGEESRVEGLEAGADDYLVKPFSARELLARVGTHLSLSRLRLELDEERRRLHRLLMTTPALVFVTQGPDHVYVLSNPLHRAAVGGRDIVGLPAREALPDLAGSGAFEILDQVYRTGEPHVESAFPTQLHPPTDDGSLRYFDWVTVPYLSAEGEIEGLMGVANEVTELVRARREAEGANRTKDEFLAMLGHELRNPLSPILTALELMRLRGGEELIRERTVIERQVRHLTRLVDDLLDMSRITRGKVSLRRREIELGEVVARAVETTSPLLEERGHRLRTDVPARGLSVRGDEERLAQVVGNLLTNAAKYTDPGGLIEVVARSERNRAVLEVRDNGVGISDDLLPHVFDLFAQGDQSVDRSQGGLGLGLTIVRNLVELHGGTVRALSEGPGRGTTIEVRLPLVEAKSKPRDEPPAVATPATETALRILVVDDNRDGAEALAEILRLRGHVAATVFDGPSALAAAAELRPDVALVDIGLPLMDGYELADRLRQVPGLEEIDLIAITGYGQPSDRQRALDAGFREHLVKPVELERLDRMLGEVPTRR